MLRGMALAAIVLAAAGCRHQPTSEEFAWSAMSVVAQVAASATGGNSTPDNRRYPFPYKPEPR